MRSGVNNFDSFAGFLISIFAKKLRLEALGRPLPMPLAAMYLLIGV